MSQSATPILDALERGEVTLQDLSRQQLNALREEVKHLDPQTPLPRLMRQFLIFAQEGHHA